MSALAESPGQKKLLKIDSTYFRGKNFDETRRHLLTCYNSNGQNHVNYLLTIVLALLAVIVGGETFFSGWLSERMFVLFSVLIVTLLLIFYSLLRSTYWTIWGNYALLFTDQEVINNFTEWNNTVHRYYENDEPSCEAILHYAVKQNVIKERDNRKWYSFRKIAILTGRLNNKKFRKY